jgi:hypothetical protein
MSRASFPPRLSQLFQGDARLRPSSGIGGKGFTGRPPVRNLVGHFFYHAARCLLKVTFWRF